MKFTIVDDFPSETAPDIFKLQEFKISQNYNYVLWKL